MTPSRFRWGLLLISFGVLLILSNADVIGGDFWWELLVWWPILLIAIGIEKIFLKTRLEFISYLAPFLIVATMVYVAIETGPDYDRDGIFSRYRWSEEIDPSVHSIKARVDHDRADIRVGHTGTYLATARIDRFIRKPDIDFSKSDGVAEINISPRIGCGGNIVIFGKHRRWNDWLVSFSDETALDLSCYGDRSDVDLNLQSIPLEKLLVENDDGEIYLKVGTLKPRLEINITGEDARLRLRVPEQAGLKVSGDEYSNYLKNIGLIETDGDYFSEKYDSTEIRIDVMLDSDLQHLSINQY
jgi:hypothetical protein